MNKKNDAKKVKKRKKKQSLVRRFFKILFTILSIYFVILFSFVGYVIYFYDGDATDISIVDNIVSVVSPKLPEVTNALIVGVDDAETRTDTIMIASYNSVINSFNLVSIPRDTLVKIPQKRWDTMLKNFPALSGNTSREIKINAINSYGKDQGIEFLKLQLEELLGININYYVKVNLEGFKYLVDSIGGIEFDVPQRMYYSDPTQNLYINLQAGIQVLDGDKAEQLVRFRGYSAADLQRVQVQQDFIKAFLKTALSTDSIISNPTAYLNTLINYIDTDFRISDAVKYISILKDFSIEKFSPYTLPGVPQYINGVSYYVTNESEIEDFVYEVFEKNAVDEEDIVLETSFGKSIQVLNGSYTSGMAAKTKEILENAGYRVDKIGDSTYEKSQNTKIYVSKEGQGRDLEQYFKDPKVIVKPSVLQEQGYDIVIIIGTEENFTPS